MRQKFRRKKGFNKFWGKFASKRWGWRIRQRDPQLLWHYLMQYRVQGKKSSLHPRADYYLSLELLSERRANPCRTNFRWKDSIFNQWERSRIPIRCHNYFWLLSLSRNSSPTHYFWTFLMPSSQQFHSIWSDFPPALLLLTRNCWNSAFIFLFPADSN